MDDRPILVTGAAGFIGSWTAQRLLDRGHRVVGLDNFDPFYDPAVKLRNLADLERSPAARGRWTFARADLTDPQTLQHLFDQHRPAGVIHLAAKAGVRPSIEDPVGYHRVNVLGTAVILEAAKAAACERLVIASSSSVYGNAPKVPFSESDDVSAPISPYAASKRACELMAFTHWHLTGMPTALLRFFTVFGPRQRPDLAIQSFILRIARNQPIRMFGDGCTSRDYTFIDDIVTGVLAAYDRIPRHGCRIWNLGGQAPVSLRDMIATIGRVVGVEPRVEPGPMQPGDVNRTWADLSRAAADLDYAPTTGFEEGVRRQWAWVRETGLAP